jgi:hypothetical protein
MLCVYFRARRRAMHERDGPNALAPERMHGAGKLHKSVRVHLTQSRFKRRPLGDALDRLQFAISRDDGPRLIVTLRDDQAN